MAARARRLAAAVALVGALGAAAATSVRGADDVAAAPREDRGDQGPRQVGLDEEEALAAASGQASTPAPGPQAPLFDFYLYRAQSTVQYPIGNVNLGNLAGVMWYLTNEVAAYSTPCRPRYNITRIRRIRVQTRATSELFGRGMNFGVRYSYDAGKCTGSNIRRLGPCTLTWNNYGYVPGCNNFRDHYPYPLEDTAYPEGIWYDFPKEGYCRSPTGSWNCTWSYQEAGDILIADLEKGVPGYEHCCNGQCTGFWSWPYDRTRGAGRVQAALQQFAKKYPDQPADLPPPPCDFDRVKFWALPK